MEIYIGWSLDYFEEYILKYLNNIAELAFMLLGTLITLSPLKDSDDIGLEFGSDCFSS